MRDGGYYTNWLYDKSLVNAYIQAADDTKIDVIEIGLRSSRKAGFKGPFAYCTESFLDTLPRLSFSKLAVMVNTEEFLGEEDLLASCFVSCEDSRVDIVRFATHFKHLEELPVLVDLISGLGYKVGVNLMQITGRSVLEIENAIETIKSLPIDVLYFADSFGNMTTHQVDEICKVIKSSWDGDIGIHTHDNTYNGLQNSLRAIENGVEWIDATVLGMGRGAGNTRMELLLAELVGMGFDQYIPSPIQSLVLDEFKKLHDEYQWGPNLIYFLAAKKNIHPSYVQELIDLKGIDSHDLLNALDYLGSSKSTDFSRANLENSIAPSVINSSGSFDTQSIFTGKNILIVGGGASVEKFKNEIIQFIKDNDVLVISLNTGTAISDEYVDVYACSHPIRVLLEAERYREFTKPVLFPLDSYPHIDVFDKTSSKLLNYGMKISHSYEAGQYGCSLKSPLVMAYALSAVVSGGASKVFLVGHDGFDSGDIRFEEAEAFFNDFQLNCDTPVISLTPTTYSIKESSIYSPWL